jgi:CheY-like chemotaxis protein
MAVRVSVALILVVDDEFSIAEVVESILLDAGHEVVTAANGQQGLERLRDRLPNLVLIDFMMPIMDGPAMLEAMKENPAYSNIPAIVMSSLPEGAIGEAVKARSAAFLRKPFKLRTVVNVVDRVLRRQG